MKTVGPSAIFASSSIISFFIDADESEAVSSTDTADVVDTAVAVVTVVDKAVAVVTAPALVETADETAVVEDIAGEVVEALEIVAAAVEDTAVAVVTTPPLVKTAALVDLPAALVLLVGGVDTTVDTALILAVVSTAFRAGAIDGIELSDKEIETSAFLTVLVTVTDAFGAVATAAGGIMAASEVVTSDTRLLTGVAALGTAAVAVVTAAFVVTAPDVAVLVNTDFV